MYTCLLGANWCYISINSSPVGGVMCVQSVHAGKRKSLAYEKFCANHHVTQQCRIGPRISMREQVKWVYVAYIISLLLLEYSISSDLTRHENSCGPHFHMCIYIYFFQSHLKRNRLPNLLMHAGMQFTITVFARILLKVQFQLVKHFI